MRTLIFFIISLEVFSKTLISFSPSDFLFSLEIKGKYRKEISKIYKVKNELICHTEINPYIPILEKKGEEKIFVSLNLFLDAYKKEKGKNACSEQVILLLKDGKKKLLCTENKQAVSFIKILAEACGRY